MREYRSCKDVPSGRSRSGLWNGPNEKKKKKRGRRPIPRDAPNGAPENEYRFPFCLKKKKWPYKSSLLCLGLNEEFINNSVFVRVNTFQIIYVCLRPKYRYEIKPLWYEFPITLFMRTQYTHVYSDTSHDIESPFMLLLSEGLPDTHTLAPLLSLLLLRGYFITLLSSLSSSPARWSARKQKTKGLSIHSAWHCSYTRHVGGKSRTINNWKN